MKYSFSIEHNDFNALENIAKEIIHLGIKKIAFSGDLGSGKTTLIKYILKELQIQNFEGSPTYSIIQQYGQKENIYHIDCYRIENNHEAFNLGFEEIFEENSYFFIEWPEKIETFLPEDIIWLYIRKELNNHRSIHFHI